MESRAGYFLVGLFVFVLVTGLMAFIVWLGRLQTDVEFAVYDVIYDSSVTGLRQGSIVRFSGVNVGEVLELALYEEDPTKVRITVEIDRMTPVREDTTATLGFEGLTGGRYILLTGGSPDAGPLLPPAPGQRPRILSRPSQLEELLKGAPEIVAGANELLARVNALLSDQNRAHFSDILADVSRISRTFAGESDRIAELIGNAAETMENVRQASESIAGLAQSLQASTARLTAQADATLASYQALAGTTDRTVVELREDLRALMGTLNDASETLSITLAEVREIVEENRQPIKDFSGSGLYELTNFLIEARGLVKQLARITTEVERDPARFFFGDRQQGYETQQP